MFELVRLNGGLHTLRDLTTGEIFHPVVGPMAEAVAIHVAPLQLGKRLRLNPNLTVWDVGLGAAANAIALLDSLRLFPHSFQCHLLSFDLTLEPLLFALENSETLGYLKPWRKHLEDLIAHESIQFEFETGGLIQWTLRLGDFTSLPAEPSPDAIFYDPYSPTKNPAMWSLEHFSRLRARLTGAAILTSYSRSTSVRVTLLLAGFFVGVGLATGEKEQTTVAATHHALLEAPLELSWLNRVRRSTNSRPIETGEPGPISGTDLEQLEKHPQFS